MKKQTHNPHRFIANIFGSTGYVALLFIWLLAIQLALMMIPSVSGDGSLLAGVTSLASYETNAIEPASPTGALLFLVLIMLAAAIWGVAHYGSMLMSAMMRFFIRMFKAKLSTESLALTKYSSVLLGLTIVAVLILVLPNEYALEKFAISFVGFIAGIIGFGAFWIQSIVASRHNVRVTDIR